MSDNTDRFRMSLIEHLEELRKRIVYSLVALAVAFAACFALKDYLLGFLVGPLNGRQLITLAPAEAFMTAFKVAAYGAIIIAAPMIIYQIWAFVAPGLKAKEKKLVYTATIFTSLLFFGGVAFCWYLVLPRGLDFLLNYQSDYFAQQVQASKYFSFVVLFALGFGLVFELPAFLLTLMRLGFVNYKTLAKNRRYAILIGAIVSAVLTPTQDIVSMMAMAVPFYVLFELSVQLGRFVQKKREKDTEIVEDGPEGEAAG